MRSEGSIGIFDSGVGGLSVRRELVARLPHEDTVYFADQRHVPYGNRTPEQLRELCETITGYLLAQGCKAVVLACNTASAAALHHLRDVFRDVPLFGMEPAVKPAASATKSGVVGIMATPATFQGQLFKATAMRYASAHRLITQICEGLVEQVEAGRLDGPDTHALLERLLEPMLTAGADTIVLACTHYAFLMPAIRRIAGPGVDVIDPAPAVGRHVHATLAARGLLTARARPARHRFVTTGDPAASAELLERLTGAGAAAERVVWAELLPARQSQRSAPPV